MAGNLVLVTACVSLSMPQQARGFKARSILRGHTGPIGYLALSPDGKIVASGEGLDPPRVWDVASGKFILLSSRDFDGAHSAAFSQDGKTLAVGILNTVKLYDLTTRKGTSLFGGKASVSWLESVPGIVFSPDGKILAAGGARLSDVVLWNVATGKKTASLKGQGGFWVVAMNFTSDGKTMITLVIKSPFSGRPVSDDKEKNGTTRFESWSLTSGKRTSVAKVKDISEISEISFLGGEAFSPDGKTFAAAVSDSQQKDNRIRLYEVATGKERATFGRLAKVGVRIAFSPDGKRLAVGESSGRITLWEVAKHKEVGRLEGHEGSVTCLAFSRDGKTLASGSDDKTIRVWDVAKVK